MTLRTRQDKAALALGATPVAVHPSGYRVYEGVARWGDVLAPYPDLDPPRVEFCPADEVMSERALASAVGIPFTGGPRMRDWDGTVTLPAYHAPNLISPDTAGEATEGSLLAAWRDDSVTPPAMRVRVIAYTAALHRLIEGGTVELSLGYRCDEDWTPGVFNGQKYDLVQRGHEYNHLNVVSRARSRTPDGRAARLDKHADLPPYPHPASETPMEDTDTDTDAETQKPAHQDAAPQGMSEADAALFKQMSPEAQALLSGEKAADEAEDAAEEAAEDAAEAALTPDASDPILAALAAIEKRLAALEGGAPAPAAKTDAPAPAPATDTKDPAAMSKKTDAAPTISDPAAVIAAATAAAKTAATATFNANSAFVAVVRNDGHKADTTDQAAAVMLSTVKEHLPVLSDTAIEHVKQGRLDSLSTLYKQAETIRRDSLIRSQADTLGDIFNAPADPPPSDDKVFRAPARAKN